MAAPKAKPAAAAEGSKPKVKARKKEKKNVAFGPTSCYSFSFDKKTTGDNINFGCTLNGQRVISGDTKWCHISIW